MDINSAWKSTCRIIFGEEIGELGGYKDYLLRYHYPIMKKQSSISGKEVALSMDRYCASARFASQDEVDYGKKYALDVNDLKDLDSLMEAISDRAYYAGNKVFGNSKFVEGSDNVVDSFHVRDSHNVTESKCIAYSAYARNGCEYGFGLSHSIGSKYSIHSSILIETARCFESWCSDNSSDLFFCCNCQGCSHAMFSFNLRSKKYAIGNVELPRDRYFALRKKLVDESREYLVKHKEFHSIFDFRGKPDVSTVAKVRHKPVPKADMEPMEAAFRSTTKIVLGKGLGPLADYGNYLNRQLGEIEKVRTALGNEIYFSNVALCYDYMPKNRINSTEEAGELGKLAVTLEDDENLGKLIAKLGKIAFYRGDHIEGQNRNTVETHWELDSVNSYRARAPSNSKNCSYCTMALHSESLLGCYRVIKSKFCIHCYDSMNLVRCFEVSDSSNCSDCYFCHNCENMQESMFCFNAKSKRYAIGNVEVGKENYARIKKLLLAEVVSKLEKNRTLDSGIYNVGCACKKAKG